MERLVQMQPREPGLEAAAVWEKELEEVWEAEEEEEEDSSLEDRLRPV